MRHMVIGVGLLLLAGSVFPRDTASQSQQAPIPNNAAAINQLRKDSDELPKEFLDLTNKIDYKKWHCDVATRDQDHGLVDNFMNALANIELNANTMKESGVPDLIELTEVFYDFGRGAQLVTLLASNTSTCTNQKDLSAKLTKLADRFSEAWENVHTIEMELVRAIEGETNGSPELAVPEPLKKKPLPTGPGPRLDTA